MVDTDRRRHERKHSFNLVNYVLLDEQGNRISRGMGRTRNLSERGFQLETHDPLHQGQLLLITVGLEEDLVELKGKVTYSMPSEEKGYSAGIEFLEIDETGRDVLRPFIVAIETGSNA